MRKHEELNSVDGTANSLRLLPSVQKLSEMPELLEASRLYGRDAVMQAIRKLIVDCVEDKYIVSLKHKYSRYNAIHPTALLTHLFENYVVEEPGS